MDLDRVATHDPVPVTDEERDAAVLVPVVERGGDPHLLFIKRASHLGEHPGQMGFPGGGREPSDDDLRETALREVEEEIALYPDEVAFVGQLDDIRTTSGYAVTPFVGRVPDREYTPDGYEVDEIVVLPLDGLAAHDNYEVERREHPRYGESLVHFFHVDGYTVWGATGRILVQFLELTLDWEPPDRVDWVIDEGP